MDSADKDRLTKAVFKWMHKLIREGFDDHDAETDINVLYAGHPHVAYFTVKRSNGRSVNGNSTWNPYALARLNAFFIIAMNVSDEKDETLMLAKSDLLDALRNVRTADDNLSRLGR
jgi:hypothetical protein